MGVYTLRDNSFVKESLSTVSIIKKLVNKSLTELYEENILIFPPNLSESADLDKENYIFKKNSGIISTCNVVGLLADEKDEIKIFSRFSSDENQDYFLRYMLSRVLNFNITNNNLSSSDDLSYEKIIIFLFPYYLKNALSKGVFKEYIKKKQNDANVRGVIDIARHIKHNIPFEGNIAYNTREFSYNNKLTQLIRHTIELIKHDYPFLLDSDDEIREQVRVLKKYTSSYSKIAKESILLENKLNPVKHGYFEEYALLQKVCIQILDNQKKGFGSGQQKINGIMFDVSWLWEEYIAKITNWEHYGRLSYLKTLRMFHTGKGISNHCRYPDFVIGNNIPVDTKYKKSLDNRNDLNQIITYIHLLKSSQGGFLQPTVTEVEDNPSHLGTLTGFGGDVFSYKFLIPQEATSYKEFVEQISNEEKKIINFSGI